MNKVVRTWLKICNNGVLLGAGMIALALLQPAVALTMDATRYVFTGDKDALSVTVSNEAGKTYGGQGWVENIVEKDTRPSFVITPSFFKVTAGGKQVLRIIKAVDLPQDKESVYWLNLQEIPPAMEGSGLKIAVRTRVKLFYRPAALMKERQGAEQKMELTAHKDGLLLKNTTPHVFVITRLLNSKEEELIADAGVLEKLSVFKPGDEVVVPGNTHMVTSIGDLGDSRTYTIGQNAEKQERHP